jgi:hypothetical protein
MRACGDRRAHARLRSPALHSCRGLLRGVPVAHVSAKHVANTRVCDAGRQAALTIESGTAGGARLWVSFEPSLRPEGAARSGCTPASGRIRRPRAGSLSDLQGGAHQVSRADIQNSLDAVSVRAVRLNVFLAQSRVTATPADHVVGGRGSRQIRRARYGCRLWRFDAQLQALATNGRASVTWQMSKTRWTALGPGTIASWKFSA